MQSWISLRNPLKWIKDKQFISKQTSESESTNVWKPNKQLTGFLRLWHVIERGKKKRAAQLCARNWFPFLPKTELIPVGYPCVGWLLLLRRRYTHRCLQICLPPAASDWIQGWDSAPQNTTRKDKMASRASAILGLLKNTIRSTSRNFFFFFCGACCLTIKKEQLFCQKRRRIDLVPSTETKPTHQNVTLSSNMYKVRKQLWQKLSHSWKVHGEKKKQRTFPSLYIYSYHW